jgi:predicted porin
MTRLAIAIAIAALPLVAGAQQAPEKSDPERQRVEVSGCVKGSTLTETNLRVSPGVDENPARRWRLRGAKELMNQLKKQSGKELQIIGTTKDPKSGLTTGGKRIGKSNVYVGAGPMSNARDPLPDLPTIDVESFEPTGEQCR